MRLLSIIICIAFFSLIIPAFAELDVDIIVDGLNNPWEIVFGPEGEIFFTERDGRVWKIENFEEALIAEEKRIDENWSPLYHYKTKGHYYQQLKRYIDLFPENQIKVILFKDIISNPQKVSKEVFDFLEVDNSFTPNTSKKANVSGSPSGFFGWIIMKMRRNNLIPNIEFSKYLPSFLTKIILSSIYTKPEKLSKELIKKLTNLHYKEDIKKLENLIKIDLSHWL